MLICFLTLCVIDQGSTSLIEMLFCTSLIAIVGGLHNNSDRKLQIINTKRQSIICDLFYPTKILGVKLNRKRLVVILEKEIYMYDISVSEFKFACM